MKQLIRRIKRKISSGSGSGVHAKSKKELAKSRREQRKKLFEVIGFLLAAGALLGAAFFIG